MLTNKKFDKLFWLALLIIMSLGIYLRSSGLSSRGIEYDEIWSYTYYSRKSLMTALTDLSTPNNHPLNSVAMRVSVFLFSDNTVALRLPAFISGLLLLVSIPLTGFLLKGSRVVFIFSTMIVSFNGALIHYSQTARGYSMQCLFISLFALSLIVAMKTWRYSNVFSYTLFLFPVLSMLTLPTSVLYIFPVCLLHCVFICRGIYISLPEEHSISPFVLLKRFMREYRGIAISYTILAGFVLFWYLYNYDSFRSGQKFGEEILSANEWAGFIYTTLLAISSPIMWGLAFFALFFKNHRVAVVATLAIIIFPFLLAPLTLAGPPRVYIPALCFLPVISALGIEGLLSRIKMKPVLVYAIGLAISIYILTIGLKEFKAWTPIDWGVVANRLIKTFDKNVYISYPVTSGLPIYANLFGVAIIDNLTRLPRGDEHLLLVVGNDISGIDADTNTDQIELPAPVTSYEIEGVQLSLHKLKNILVAEDSELEDCALIFAALGPGLQKEVNSRVVKVINSIDGLWILCNPWLNRTVLTKDQEPHIGKFLACRLPEGTDLRPLKNAAVKYRSELSFYVLDK